MNTGHASGTDEFESIELLGELAEDFARRLRNGERPDIETYARGRPQLAEVIRQTFPALAILHCGDPSASDLGECLAASGSSPSPCLGDYRILREIGRGGMGVVYEAEQISLQRRVAVKVLPFAAVLDDRQLKRFKNEALAAAAVHHQNIVPVYAVGCERGVHYYAMQFIDGPTLAEVIRALARLERSPATRDESGTDEFTQLLSSLASRSAACQSVMAGRRDGSSTRACESTRRGRLARSTCDSTRTSAFFRSVAVLGIEVARALHHAHQEGVIHRDIKPSNLILDRTGKVWVTDFGLARIGDDPGVTLSGDVLGTLRYMSPEQAAAGPSTVDHRTDVYSLGVTLYELLALRPAVDGSDRRDILRRIAHDEPTPLRRIRREIPRELETIVLSAIAKDRKDRYRTAGELADDLKRFLEDRPIRAKRPTLVQRAIKWTRRHRSLVAAAVVMLLLATTGLLASTMMIWSEKKATQAALAQAETNFQNARDAIDRVTTRVAEGELSHAPGMEHVRRELLEDALAFYERFLQSNGHNPDVVYETARAHLRVGDLYVLLGRHRDAAQHYIKSIDLLSGLAKQEPSNAEYREYLALAFTGRANLHVIEGEYPRAERAFRDAQRLDERLLRESADDVHYLGQLACNLRESSYVLLQAGRPVLAEREATRAIRLYRRLVSSNPQTREYATGLARAEMIFGMLCCDEQRFRQAESMFRNAVAIDRKLVDATPDSPAFRYDLAVAMLRLARLPHLDRGEAHALSGQALKLLAELVRDYPSVPDYQWELAGGRESQAMSDREPGAAAGLVEAFRRSAASYEELAEKFPTVLKYRLNAVSAHRNIGLAARSTARFDEGERAFRRAIELGRRLVRDFPETPQTQLCLARCYSSAAELLKATRNSEEACRCYRAATALYEKLVADHPEVPMYRRYLIDNALNFAVHRMLPGNEDDVRATYRAAIAQGEKLVSDYPMVGKYRRRLGLAYEYLGDVLAEEEQFEAADRAYGRSLDLHCDLVTSFPHVGDYHQVLAIVANKRIVFLFYMPNKTHAGRALRHVVDQMSVIVARFETDHASRRCLGLALEYCGRLASRSGQYRQAVAYHRRAVSEHLVLTKQSPQVRLYHMALAINRYFLSRALNRCGRVAEAIQAAQEAMADLDRLREVDHGTLEQDVVRRRAKTAAHLAGLLFGTDQRQAARESYKVARSAYEVLVHGKDHSPADLNAAAWLLATCPVSDLRDLPHAVDLARQAVRRSPKKATYWNTLGIAQLQVGEWADAAASLERSVQLGGDDDPSNYGGLALLYFERRDWRRAAAACGKALTCLGRQALRRMEQLHPDASHDFSDLPGAELDNNAPSQRERP